MRCVVESVEDDVVVLSDGCGLHEGAKASTRIYDGERVWHLTFRVARASRARAAAGADRARAAAIARCSARSAGCRACACRLAATAAPRGRLRGLGLGERASTSRRAAWRCARASTYGAGDLIDVDLDDGTGAVISARVEVVDLIADEAGGSPRPHRGRRRRRRPAPRCARRPPARLAERRRAAARAAARAARGAAPPLAACAAAARRRTPARYAQRGGSDATSPRASRTAPGSPRSSRACRRGSRSIARRSARDLARRQAGYGRSPRQQIEQDDVEILGGVRHGLTLGGPLALIVRNRDHANWGAAMSAWPVTEEELAEVAARRSRKVQLPRPGPRRPRRAS